jgi:hypothetical protein
MSKRNPFEGMRFRCGVERGFRHGEIRARSQAFFEPVSGAIPLLDFVGKGVHFWSRTEKEHRSTAEFG